MTLVFHVCDVRVGLFDLTNNFMRSSDNVLQLDVASTWPNAKHSNIVHRRNIRH